MTYKKITALLVLTFCFVLILSIFYWQEWQYTQPTPIPANYEAVAVNSKINLPDLASGILEHKPVFVHFFNPECPCSVFNAKHFNELHQEYSTNIEFLVVIPEESNMASAEKILPENIKIVHDRQEAIAKSCGVYSSPQAVILDDSKIYFKGNYNKARYCTTKDTNYAALALENFLNRKPSPTLDAYATLPYGCEFKKSNSFKIFNF